MRRSICSWSLLKAIVPNLGEALTLVLALIPAYVMRGWIFQLVTYSFVHAGVMHILFNMLGLWMFGAQLESDWGQKRFLEFYFFCVIGAALTTIAISYTGVGGVVPQTPTVGASGGVLGILMAFGMLYGDREIMLFPIPLTIRAKYFVAGVAFITLVEAHQCFGRGPRLERRLHRSPGWTTVWIPVRQVSAQTRAHVRSHGTILQRA